MHRTNPKSKLLRHSNAVVNQVNDTESRHSRDSLLCEYVLTVLRNRVQRVSRRIFHVSDRDYCLHTRDHRGETSLVVLADGEIFPRKMWKTIKPYHFPHIEYPTRSVKQQSTVFYSNY